MYILYLALAILMFGVLIAVHEFGHFAVAKLTGVKVNEFSIGMGPQLWKRQKGETLYSFRLFPVGGFCAMEGEDEETGDPRAFTAQPAWKKILILIAGAFMNFLFGLLVVLVLFSSARYMTTTEIDHFMDGFPLESEQGLMAGDRIVSINGQWVRPTFFTQDFALLMSRANGVPVDVVVERNGTKVRLEDLPLELRDYPGQSVRKYGIYFRQREMTLVDHFSMSWNQTMDFVRMVWFGLSDLVHGRAGLSEMSGPIGIIDTIGEAGAQAQAERQSLMDGIFMVMVFVAFIAVNLAVMNMLPIPALDGGRVFFVLVNALIALITHKKIDPKYEGYVHAAGFILLIGLMIVVALNDVWKLIS